MAVKSGGLNSGNFYFDQPGFDRFRSRQEEGQYSILQLRLDILRIDFFRQLELTAEAGMAEFSPEVGCISNFIFMRRLGMEAQDTIFNLDAEVLRCHTRNIRQDGQPLFTFINVDPRGEVKFSF